MRSVAVLFFLLLATCGSLSTVRAMRADAEGVTFEFPTERQDDATRQAMLYCANLGRGAVLESSRREGGDDSIATYGCR
jgi:hypothetical protein